MLVIASHNGQGWSTRWHSKVRVDCGRIQIQNGSEIKGHVDKCGGGSLLL